ncbi:hypothetical protein, partial [uncultured Bacteroides sp.]
MSRISTSESLKNKFTSIANWVESQMDECNDLSVEIDALQNALTYYHNYSQSILLAIRTEEIESMVHTICSYAEALQRILDGFNTAAEHNPDEKTISKLNEIKSRIISKGQNVLQMLSDIENATSATRQGYQTAYERLENSLNKFRSLSPEGYLLPEKTVKTLAVVTEKLSQVEGILDPLASLIEVLRENGSVRKPCGYVKFTLLVCI